MTVEELISDIEFRAFLLYPGDDNNDTDNMMSRDGMDSQRLDFIDGLTKGYIRATSAYLHNVF
ncbi:hypothetical protein Q0M91_14480, partial [Staphylococcus aureus]|nr:hypothetical protein [Staphylococcus aureus]